MKSFLNDLQNKRFTMSSNDPNVNYKSITEDLLETTDKQASLKNNYEK